MMLMRTYMDPQTTMQLIEGLHAARCLWDKNSDEYQDRYMKQQELEKLAFQFNATVEEITKRIKSLKTQFRREHKKMLSIMNDPKKSHLRRNTWFGYENLMFLLDGEAVKDSNSKQHAQS
ncbi:unnamed protein product [Acanthoscelides obtectus]|uniref:MADF domain-containing protein n=1 Tax=Acanthoscelides obtectus TaxID=200917 RepID=A0A9P0JUW0_ACAOB|nr:unnamed protein product [Acanthoscelides obtectus]CAK1667956.1 hypothetical protein AOBTE_LOCUS26137 [Acanthoscelides obtectus]